MQYKQLLTSEREAIKLFLDLGISHNQIAKHLNRNQATITREINRNSINGIYKVKIAKSLTLTRRIKANHSQIKIVSGSRLESHIIDKITNQELSPEQIAGRLKYNWDKLNLEHSVSHETIYSWIYGLEDLELKHRLIAKFRSTKGKYRRRHGTRQRRKECEELKKKRIDQRPEIVETRATIGHWEIDTIVGGEKTIHILTEVERKTGYLLARKLDTITADETNQQILLSYENIPKDKILTQTSDNGVQFNKLEVIEAKLGIQVYYAYPYHSWERGTNENTNGLLRQYYPKGSMFNSITQEDLDQVVKKLNNRPRKRLNYRTPHEVFILEMEF